MGTHEKHLCEVLLLVLMRSSTEHHNIYFCGKIEKNILIPSYLEL